MVRTKDSSRSLSNATLAARAATLAARAAGLVAAVALLAAMLVVPTAANAAVGSARIDLKVLVLDDGTGTVEPVTTALTREGVPYSSINVAAAHTAITQTGGANALSIGGASPRAYYQAIVSPTNLADLDTLYTTFTTAERTAIENYEKAFGVRQVDVNVYPSTTVGLNTPAFSGPIDGSAATLTTAATAGAFSYLDGTFSIDDVDPAVDEVYGYLATPVTPAAAGTSFTSLVTVPAPSAPATVGSLVGVYAAGGREELVITAAANGNQTWLQSLAHGILSWATRGVYLGYDRHYYIVHVDDVFLPDSRWSASGKCTPGDDCLDPAITTPDIRMVPSDVSRLTAWQTANNFRFDLVFNGGGSEEWITNNGSDPLATDLLAAKNNFRWINHTYTHPFLGCEQDVSVRPWQCQANPGPGDVVTGELNASKYKWRPYSSTIDPDNLGILQEIQYNQQWATDKGLPNYNSTELVTGEHSGLLTTPQQPMDNPNLGPALTARGILLTGSDASREPDSRTVAGSTTKTLPRYPSNIYYNAATYTDEVAEYNYVYTKLADGGSGVCETNASSTCITPLAMATPAQAEASFKNYIVPLETKIALAKVLTNDPRPHYAHQSNFAEDAILLSTTKSVLDGYRGVFADNAPITSPTMTEQAAIMARAGTWASSGKAATTAYLDATGVHLTGGAGTVPLTVPTTSTGSAVAGLSSYAGALSGWTGTSASAVADPGDVGYGNGTAPTAPLAPAAPTGTAGDASVALSWVAPADGNSPITSYTVTPYIGATAQTSIVTPTNATTLTIPGLTNATGYTFTVAATNLLGTGPASPASVTITPRTVPGAPTAVTGTAGNASVALSWVAPVTDGGSPITSYTVTPYLGAVAQPTVVTPTNATTATVSGLTDAAYTFTVAATNVAGTGVASAPSSAITPISPPVAPTAVAGTGGDHHVALTWTAPAADGGSPVTAYTITPYLGATAQTPVLTPTNATSFDVTGLVNGTAYTFTVAATNLAGTGAASVASTAVTPSTVPDAPASNPVGVSSAGQVALTWTAPVFDGGSPVTTYVVTPYAAGVPQAPIVTASTTPAFTVTGLANGTTYTFTVNARNLNGDGAASGLSNSQTPITVPGTPIAPIGTPSNGSIALTWTAPSAGGATITSYTITPYIEGVAQTPIPTGTGVTSRNLTGLTNGTAYTVTITAKNAAGVGTESAQSLPVTPRTLPGTPGVATGIAMDASIALTWAAPAADGGAAITSYTITPYRDGTVQPAVVTPTGATTYTVTGLDNGKSYRFRIAATNAAGTGSAAALSITVVPRAVPGTPTAVAGTAGDSIVVLDWTAPASDGGAPITSYRITPYIGVAPQPTVVTPTNASAFEVTGLTNGTVYTFTVAAINAAGPGADSVPSDPLKPVVVASAPTTVTGTASDAKVDLSWVAPASDGGSPITSYRITPYVGATPKTQIDTGSTALTASVTGLTNGTSYTFRVAATTSAGTGAASVASAPLTPRTTPSVPAAPAVARGDKSAVVTWVAPHDGGSPISGYTVLQVKDGVESVAGAVTGGVRSHTVTGLTNGAAYTFKVRATNGVGTGNASSGSVAVTPSGAPSVVLTKLAPAAAPISLAPKVTYTWSGYANGSEIDHYDLYAKRAAFGKPVPASWTKVGSAKTTSAVVTLKPGETVLLAVQAVDKVGVGSELSVASSMVALPLNKLTKVGKSWKKLKSSSYYGGKALRSTKKGAKLKAGTVTKATRLAVVGSTGKGYGKVSVLIAGKKVATVNFKAKSADANAVVLTKTFGARSGKVTFVLASGKQVRIQGIAVVR